MSLIEVDGIAARAFLDHAQTRSLAGLESGRIVYTLLLHDDVAGDQGDHDQDSDRDEITEVLADRGGHLAPPTDWSLLISAFRAGFELAW